MLGPCTRIGSSTNLKTTVDTTINTRTRKRVRSGRRPNAPACHHGTCCAGVPSPMQYLLSDGARGVPARSSHDWNPDVQKVFNPRFHSDLLRAGDVRRFAALTPSSPCDTA